ncbi:MAG: penicillin-binding protein 2 [Rhodobacteraceae bacterium]|nr:penicillin-binding protein 2 [Paracoccaceae bacterium]
MTRAAEKRAQSHERRLKRRAVLLGVGQLAVVGLLGGRVHYLQVKQADRFRLLAEENRINTRLLPPARGEIFDRSGVPLAENTPDYRIIVVPEDAGDLQATLFQLSRLIALAPEDIERVLAEAEAQHSEPFLPVTVARHLPWEAFSRVAVNAPALPGITPEVGLSRRYPMKESFVHLIGYVGPVSDSDLSREDPPDPLLRIPRFQVGKIGLEAQREAHLRGKAGIRRLEVNASGRIMRELERQKSTHGEDVQITVDHRLQAYVQARLEGQSAAAVVIDCQNGDILAMTSAPAYDPNLFVQGISSRSYRALIDNAHRPLVSKSVQGVYPPGSTFKMITALAALETQAIGREDTVWCPGRMRVSDREFHCWKRGGHGHMNMFKALRESCDVYFYELALRVGIDTISAMAHRLGLGLRYDLPLSAIAQGLIPTRQWKERARGQVWLPGDTVNAAIGQGFVLASPLQLAVMTARLASGKRLHPRLIKSVNGQETPPAPAEPMAIAAEHLHQVRRALYAVSNDRRGTAYGSRIVDDNWRLAGKTGTSQVRNITAAERLKGLVRNEDLPWERRDHALFVSFAPHEAPQVAVAVVVEHGGSGSKAAAPIARDILLRSLHEGPPPLSAYPEKDRPQIKEQQERMRSRLPAPQIPQRVRS